MALRTDEIVGKSPLHLLNALLAAFGAAQLEHVEPGSALAGELAEAHPLLAMLVQMVCVPEASAEVKEDVRHNWNKALRRRGWRALPALEGPDDLRAAQIKAIQDWLSTFGVSWTPADDCPAEALESGAALCGVLTGRLRELLGPPLPSPGEYERTTAELRQTWNELSLAHPNLPKL